MTCKCGLEIKENERDGYCDVLCYTLYAKGPDALWDLISTMGISVGYPTR